MRTLGQRPWQRVTIALCGALAACSSSRSGSAVDGGGDAPVDGAEQAATDGSEEGGDSGALGSDARADSATTDGPSGDAATGDAGADATPDGSGDANGALGSGAVCDTSHDECGAGLKCCYSPGLPLDGSLKQSTCMIDTCTPFPP
jgi:hypothetical protein